MLQTEGYLAEVGAISDDSEGIITEIDAVVNINLNLAKVIMRGVPRGIDYTMVSIPSSRNRATIHRIGTRFVKDNFH